MAKAELDDLSTTLDRCYRPLECFACRFFVYVGSPSGAIRRWRGPVEGHDFAAAGDMELLVDPLHVGADCG